jgi:hypothetical protein
VTSTIRSTDTGWKSRVDHLRAAERDAARWEVVVGVLADEKGNAPADGGDFVVLDLANVHEFGSEDGHVPQRSFIRAWTDQNHAQVVEWQREMMRAVAAGQLDIRLALERLGLKIAGAIQAFMATSIPPPNAESTIARKGSSTTLIDSGQLRSSVTHQLRPKGGAA